MPEPADSGVYVYGIVSSTGATAPDDVQGMDGHGVELVTHGELGALVTMISLPRPPGRRRDLLSHSDVLNAVAQDLDVVPLRFGTVLPNAGAVVSNLLLAHTGALTRMLEYVSDAVQLNLRATYVEERVLADVVQGNRDIEWLHRRTRHLPTGVSHPDSMRLGRLVSLELDEMRRYDSAMLAECVLPLVRDSRERARAATDHVLDLALLVDREAVAIVEAELEDVAADIHERIRLQLSEPLAPFDFVKDEPWD